MSEPAAPELLEERIGHRFRDRALLEVALTHASRAHERGGGQSNERLEFLGDAVLDLVVAELLYATHPAWEEGSLTRTRASLVNRGALADCARLLHLGRFVRLGRTEERSQGAEKDSILANCFEALVGALYLDAGLGPVVALVKETYGDQIETGAERDPKTKLQEWAHARSEESPIYHTISDSGTENDEQRFTVEVRVGERPRARGVGRSKRLAERAAARAALEQATAGDG